ncbi:MAG TPA: hypothetical protein VGC65_00185 [Bacteroidia bacterium]|jgi:hypothetical protein
MKSPEIIYKLAPQLQDIANRLSDSVRDVEVQNRERVSRNSDARKLYPEHCRITQIYINNHWEDTALRAKPGKEDFEESLVKIVNSRDPQALRVAVYNGKRTTSNHDLYTIYLAEDAEVISEIKNDGLKGPEEGLSVMKTEIDRLKKGDIPESTFQLQLIKLEHKQELYTLEMKHEREIEKKDRIIEDLESEIEDLKETIDDQDADLGSAADKLIEKVQPKPIHIILAAAFEEAAEKFIINRPKVLTEVLKLSEDQVKDIFARSEKQIAPATKETSGAEFSEVTNDQDEYKGFDADHAEALRNIHIFNKSLTPDKFKLLYNVFAFCCTSEGEFNEEHTKILLAHLLPIDAAEKENK